MVVVQLEYFERGLHFLGVGQLWRLVTCWSNIHGHISRCEILRSDGDKACGKYVIVYPVGEDTSKKKLRSEEVLREGRKKKTFRID